MLSLFKKNSLSSTESIDIIENIVYEYLKPFGFKKHGRTLHRFVDGDISQVVHFQNGSPKSIHDVLWVNLGIRVPECAERRFFVSAPAKKYYYEYECNIRTRLGELVDNKDTFYDLKKDPEKIANDIVKRLKKYALPVFEALKSRSEILSRRRDFSSFDRMNQHLILLEESMIYGRMGDTEKAEKLFSEYYKNELREYEQALEHGRKIYLKKGEKIVYRNSKTNQTETITAQKNGFVELYDANRNHLDYLDKLADELGIKLAQ